MDTLDQLRQLLHDRIGVPPEEITPASKLEDIGVDSLQLLNLMFDLEEQFGVTLPNDLPRPQTVAELVAVFDGLKSRDAG